MSSEFVALDVETANEKRGSICAVGLVTVRDSEIVHRYETLCVPPGDLNYFTPRNIAVHGITPDHISGAPKFAEILPTLVAYIGGRVVVAHNASFERSALLRACETDGISYPAVTFGCTLQWSKALLDLESFRLPVVADHLGVALNRHHDALSDAEACARICLELMSRADADTVDGLASRAGSRSAPLGGRMQESMPAPARPTDNPAVSGTPAHQEAPFRGSVVVITGRLSTSSRSEAERLVTAAGGTVATRVTPRTRYLVIGDGYRGDLAGFHGAKVRAALTMIERGSGIRLLSETDMLTMLGSLESTAQDRNGSTRTANPRSPFRNPSTA
ncbi:exonuclease domain-containing protein [Actinoalloteichus spitiensis]|uniref:exonuclease domain-containing protein n=1 Tax=Actinoalloteichus spitiensis TaxID=252394 RepID=UPI00036904B8|nr:exonuclease domain-containing protein [Actinoalloteichus spitiensis]